MRSDLHFFTLQVKLFAKVVVLFLTILTPLKVSSEDDKTRMLLSFDTLECPLAFDDIQTFKVEELKGIGNEISEETFYSLFQDRTDTMTSGEGYFISAGIKHTAEYLLTKHAVDSDYHVVTLRKQTNSGDKIYWLSYFSQDIIIPMSQKSSIHLNKGLLGNCGVLSEQRDTDSSSYSSYSYFFDNKRIIKTELTKNYRTLQFDSIVHYQELELHRFNDGFVAWEVGYKHYRNKVLIDTMWDEVEWIKLEKAI